MQIWNGCNALNIAGNSHKIYQCKIFISEFPDQKLKNDQTPPWFWHLVEILENLLLHVLFNDACIFATNLFPDQLRAIWKC